MKARSNLMELSRQIIMKIFESPFRFSEFTITATISTLIFLYIIISMSHQTSSEVINANLLNSKPTQMRFQNWTAEYFDCPHQQLEPHCTRVLKKTPSGSYIVDSEILPLNPGLKVGDKLFSKFPTHVRLSHTLSNEDLTQFKKNWENQKTVFALFGQPVCNSGICETKTIVKPANVIKIGAKTLLQFDSQVDFNGRFGPEGLSPLAVSQGEAYELFIAENKHHRGLFFELGLIVIAPFFTLLLALWTGRSKVLIAFGKFLSVKSLWMAIAIDIFAKQTLLFKNFTLEQSFALAAFLSGWMFSTAVNFLSIVWSQSNLTARFQTNLAAGFSLIALGVTYFVPANNSAAAATLRIIEITHIFACAIFLALAQVALRIQSSNTNWLERFKKTWAPEKNVFGEKLVKGLFLSFLFTLLISLSRIIFTESMKNSFDIETIILPFMISFVVLKSRPQLTHADIQKQKEFTMQQEDLVKHINQLNSIKHRTQAINFVLNFCHRELPKLGVENSQFLETLPSKFDKKQEDKKIIITSIVRSAQQTFGWLVSETTKRTEETLTGEKILHSLSISLAQQLDNNIKNVLLESEAHTAQKFIPKDLLKFFGILSLRQLNPNQEYSVNGSVVTVILRDPTVSEGTLRDLPDSVVINEFNALFHNVAAEFGGYVAHQDRMKWNIIFGNKDNSTLAWIEKIQTTFRQLNQRKQSLGMKTYECSFGVSASQIFLRVNQAAGVFRPWIQFDINDVSASLAKIATEYQSTVFLSDHFVKTLDTAAAIKNSSVYIRLIDRIWNNTKTSTIDVFEYYGGESEPQKTQKRRTASLFGDGIKFYLEGNFEKARLIFKQIIDADPNDQQARRVLLNISDMNELKAA